jgi:hypothetical protein
MKRATRVPLLLASLCFFPAAAFAQTTSAVCKTSFEPPVDTSPPVANAPYSAVQEYWNVQTLADGTHVTRKRNSYKIYRDAEGRTRTEWGLCDGPGGTPDAIVISIIDPVSGYSYVLDQQNQVAHRFIMKAREPSDSAVGTANIVPAQTAPSGGVSSQPAQPTVTTESLGTQVMEGVLVKGRRTTRVIPEGLEGNDRPLTVVSEVWRSSELKIVVLSKTNDPRGGESTFRLKNVDLSNPILYLFQPPGGYKVVDETKRITLTYTRP